MPHFHDRILSIPNVLVLCTHNYTLPVHKFVLPYHNFQAVLHTEQPSANTYWLMNCFLPPWSNQQPAHNVAQHDQGLQLLSHIILQSTDGVLLPLWTSPCPYRSQWPSKSSSQPLYTINQNKIHQYHYRPKVPRVFQEVKVPRLRDNCPGWW